MKRVGLFRSCYGSDDPDLVMMRVAYYGNNKKLDKKMRQELMRDWRTRMNATHCRIVVTPKHKDIAVYVSVPISTKASFINNQKKALKLLCKEHLPEYTDLVGINPHEFIKLTKKVKRDSLGRFDLSDFVTDARSHEEWVLGVAYYWKQHDDRDAVIKALRLGMAFIYEDRADYHPE